MAIGYDKHAGAIGGGAPDMSPRAPDLKAVAPPDTISSYIQGFQDLCERLDTVLVRLRTNADRIVGAVPSEATNAVPQPNSSYILGRLDHLKYTSDSYVTAIVFEIERIERAL